MCGTARFAATATTASLLQPDRVGDRVPTTTQDYISRPGGRIPALVKSQEETILTGMTWGFEGGKWYNARSETVHTNAHWSSWYAHLRCVIPMLSFYEGDAWFEPSQSRLFLAAGIWRPVKFATVKTTWWQIEASMLTQAAIGEVVQYHHRMPVMMGQNLIDRWLEHDIEADFLVRMAKEDSFELAA